MNRAERSDRLLRPVLVSVDIVKYFLKIIENILT